MIIMFLSEQKKNELLVSIIHSGNTVMIKRLGCILKLPTKKNIKTQYLFYNSKLLNKIRFCTNLLFKPKRLIFSVG